MNAPTPYQGKEKYIFISYSHRDTDRVFPIIFALMDNGYRVWYDQGIDPGTEWDENIAMHINDCGYFIAFISENYLGSSNCKDELNYARDLEKDRLIVYLEDVNLPAGMAMRVNRLQSIFKHTYTNEKDFYDKLFAANNINVCLAEKSADENKESPKAAPAEPKTEPNTGAEPYPQNGNINFVNEMSLPVKNKLLAGLLALFLGLFGVHKFYLGKKLAGILYILFFWTYIPSVLALIDAIVIFTMSEEKFKTKYRCRLG